MRRMLILERLEFILGTQTMNQIPHPFQLIQIVAIQVIWL